jgi:hypothetical protein
MKKIILGLFFNLLFLTDSYSKFDNKEVNVSCSGTGEYSVSSSFNWFDDYKFIFSPVLTTDLKKVTGYILTKVILENCNPCMGRNEDYYSMDSQADGLIVKDSSIIITQKGKTEIYTTISRYSGNFSSIDKVQYGQTIGSRRGVCKNIDLLYAKIDEYKNFKASKSIGNPKKETDTGAKDLLKKIIGK